MNARLVAAVAAQAVIEIGEGLMLLAPFAASAYLMHVADSTGATFAYVPAAAGIAIGLRLTIVKLITVG